MNRRKFLELSAISLLFGFSALLRLPKSNAKKSIAKADKAKVFPGKVITHSENFKNPAKWAG